jgi:hypothetical protein
MVQRRSCLLPLEFLIPLCKLVAVHRAPFLLLWMELRVWPLHHLGQYQAAAPLQTAAVVAVTAMVMVALVTQEQ